jgi:hypothetical protein
MRVFQKDEEQPTQRDRARERESTQDIFEDKDIMLGYLAASKEIWIQHTHERSKERLSEGR